jgi:ribonuclease VapC
VIIDTSAWLAILQAERESAALIAAIAASPLRYTSVLNIMEASMITYSRKGGAGEKDLEEMLNAYAPEIAIIDSRQTEMARAAFRVFGKGHHPAALNFVDCYVYALAKSKNLPLLFKGNDFSQTDIEIAVY